MKFKLKKDHVSLGITAFLVIAASILFYYFLFHWDRFSYGIDALNEIISPVLYGMILAYLLTPIVNSLEQKLLKPLFIKKSPMNKKKRNWMRGISITLTVIIVLALLYGFFSVVIPNLISSIQSISLALPTYVNNLSKFLSKYLEANPDLQSVVNQVVTMYSTEFNQYVNTKMLPQMESLLRTVSLSIFSMLQVLWNLIIGLIISIYVLFSKETFAGQAKKITYSILPVKSANGLIRDMRFVSDTFIGFISGKIVDSIIIGLLCFIGATLLNLPYTLLVSVIVGVTNVIPFFGPYMGAIPSAFIILMVDPVKCLTFVIFIIILQQADGNFIGPKILGQSTGLTGFWVIFSITIFGGLLGVFGMIIGVPFFAVVYALVKRVVERRLTKKNLPVGTPSYVDLDYIDISDTSGEDFDAEKQFVKRDPDAEDKPFFKMFSASKSKKNVQDLHKDECREESNQAYESDLTNQSEKADEFDESD